MRTFIQALAKTFGLKSVASTRRQASTTIRKPRLHVEELENRLVPAPISALLLSNNTAPEFSPPGAVVGTLSAMENGSGHTFTYSLVPGTGSSGNNEFAISGNQLVTNDALDNQTQPSYSILVNATDENNQTFQQNFIINVANNPNIVRNGSTLNVYGTPGDDTFTFTADPTQDSIVVNGTTYAVNSSPVSTINIMGGGGNDTATIIGDTQGTNSLVMSPAAATMTGTGYQVNVTNVNNITGIGGNSDSATLYDATGSNNFVSTPGSSTFFGGTFSETATGFGQVNGVSAVGTNDSAVMYDGSGSNAFVASPTYSVLSGTGYEDLVAGFKTASAREVNGTNDTGYLYDNSGTNIFTSHPGSSTLTSSDNSYFNETVGFQAVTAFSAPGTNDTAYLYDQAGASSVFVATPTDAHIQGPGFFKQVVGFGKVNAYASAGSNDYAYLSDTGGSNIFYSSPTASYLSGSTYFNNAVGFTSVQATSAPSANDTATFVGSLAGGNTFTSTTAYSYMYGTGYVAAGYGFKNVTAQATKNDTANLYDGSGTTVSPQSDTGSVNTFQAQGNTGTFYDDNQTYSTMGFGYVNLIQKTGAYDQASTSGADYTVSESGNWHNAS